MRTKIIGFGFAGLVLTAGTLQAAPFAPTPDAGSLLREQEPQRMLPSDQLKKPEVEPFEEGMQPDDGVRVRVKGFSFQGYEGVITEKELNNIVASSVGQELSFGDLQRLTNKITSVLKERGWFLSWAYLPKQDITQGIIIIRVEQGKSDGTVRYNLEQAPRLKQCFLENMIGDSVAKGKAMNQKEFEKAVVLMNDIPGVISAKASLSSGFYSGTSQIDLTVVEGPLVSGNVSEDNFGNRYTGEWRTNAQVTLNDLSGCGDKLDFTGTYSGDLRQGAINYSFPILYDGLRGNVGFKAMHYELGKELSVYGFDGGSYEINLGLDYPIIRTRKSIMVASAGYAYRELKDQWYNGQTYRERYTNDVSFGLKGERWDSILGNSYTSFRAMVTLGDLNRPVDLLGTNLAETGQFSRFNFALYHLHHLAPQTTASISWTGQLAPQNLDTSEQFSLGGPYGVRAYPLGEGLGDQGQMINVDLRYAIPVESLRGSVQLFGFYDAGQVQLHHDLKGTNVDTATGKNTYWLQGAGLGVNYDYSSRFSLRGSWAHAIGKNPGRDIYGNNSDGKDDRDRFWLQAVLFF
ncbi:Polypeptide-transport-associated domain protein ShlB-type [Chlorobaculum parvum NCIB 8327]|uniref:Polypeptide-transport-associated domain protein ShlB-type n=1 Tax=Chlorobaculum parvum (strain DSM 263 / NCIMB 8327) TaxID=517417 RepID=B3QPC8_CHLP8|nr:ShlB/FhaC/HecB family hemolysin secretion/activation protein [Chlorobaculum parvum]ACF11781.1 Polypeptide-transport-associated domain protein ShlB-type [Chlorobaculum parvum NCIB 8327]